MEINYHGETWMAVKRHLLAVKNDLTEKLIKKDDERVRGKIHLIDDLLGLEIEKTSPAVEQINYFKD